MIGILQKKPDVHHSWVWNSECPRFFPKCFFGNAFFYECKQKRSFGIIFTENGFNQCWTNHQQSASGFKHRFICIAECSLSHLWLKCPTFGQNPQTATKQRNILMDDIYLETRDCTPEDDLNLKIVCSCKNKQHMT